jgi:speckle-type POZ protein
MMILPYEWILENVEEEPMTIASKMISFRGEKIFRVGLKNHAQSPVLFLVAINLYKIGMEVEDVMYGIQGSGTGPATMTPMTGKRDLGVEGSLQLFKTVLDKQIVGTCTFAFRIVIAGTNEYYAHRLCDRLAKDQLWAALKNQQNLADVEFVVNDTTFPVHKAVLAARGYSFRAESEKLSILPVEGGPQRIRIDDVEPSTVEKFLHYMYTGEPKGTFADEGLFQLAEKYNLVSLEISCEYALKETEAPQMTRIMDILNAGLYGGVDVVLSSSKIM